MRFFLACCCLLGVQLSCSEPAALLPSGGSLPNTDLLINTAITGEYRWVQSIPTDANQAPLTPSNSSWEQTLVITDNLFTWLRNGQAILHFPYVTLAGLSPDQPDQFRIFDADWSQVRYQARLSGKRLYLEEVCCEQLRSFFLLEE